MMHRTQGHGADPVADLARGVRSGVVLGAAPAARPLDHGRRAAGAARPSSGGRRLRRSLSASRTWTRPGVRADLRTGDGPEFTPLPRHEFLAAQEDVGGLVEDERFAGDGAPGASAVHPGHGDARFAGGVLELFRLDTRQGRGDLDDGCLLLGRDRAAEDVEDAVPGLGRCVLVGDHFVTAFGQLVPELLLVGRPLSEVGVGRAPRATFGGTGSGVPCTRGLVAWISTACARGVLGGSRRQTARPRP
ncbi:hypothetical protein FHU36_003833 [Nonomuraea muscovyensis]|uniref:Uncharacterized protein n=1 Tax=Nonomuraea muscovyensis TaxID=1124761 RepID=A0A7X0C327_9ACTN|nr:hypothetical protein [Nonomuraea muscovyensis]